VNIVTKEGKIEKERDIGQKRKRGRGEVHQGQKTFKTSGRPMEVSALIERRRMTAALSKPGTK